MDSYFNKGSVGSVESKPEPVSVFLPVLSPLFELDWLPEPDLPCSALGNLKAPARLLLTVSLRGPVEAREACTLPGALPFAADWSHRLQSKRTRNLAVRKNRGPQAIRRGLASGCALRLTLDHTPPG